jgi:hypothetical protein
MRIIEEQFWRLWNTGWMNWILARFASDASGIVSLVVPAAPMSGCTVEPTRARLRSYQKRPDPGHMIASTLTRCATQMCFFMFCDRCAARFLPPQMKILLCQHKLVLVQFSARAAGHA